MQGNIEATPNQLDISREEMYCHKFQREQRVKWKIEIKSIKTMKTLDYINSLPLDESFLQALRKRNAMGDQHIYFFEVDITDAKAHKSTVKWNLRKRYLDFVNLSKDMHQEIHKEKKLKNHILPSLPKIESGKGIKELLNQDSLGRLTVYLQNLVDDTCLRENSQLLYEFLEISLLPLPDGPKKYKEGYLKKRTGGRYKENMCQMYCGVFCRRWVKRWFIVNNEGILYVIDSNSTRVREMLLFDRSFRIEYGRQSTGTNDGISLIAPNRKLNLQAENVFEAVDWIMAIIEAVRECPYVAINRYSSFAPVRPPTAGCRWYIDGEHYFEDIYHSLLQAKKEVFIADWWLSPELHLKRPVVDESNTYRLDTVLANIAKRGVLVYIIVYREVKIALNNDSEYTKKALEALSPNIKVLRHPNEFLCLWSHHEKMVVVDQKIGYIGGLDLCYGRMDINSHPLNDPALEQGFGETFPGIDFVNLRTSDFRNVRDHNTCTIDKMSQPRMPWHDIAMRVVGEPTRDLSRHFIQYWNFAKIDLQPTKEEYFLTPLENKVPQKQTREPSSAAGQKKPGLRSKISQIIKKSFARFDKDESPMHIRVGDEDPDKSLFEEYMEHQIHQPNILSEDNWDGRSSARRKATTAKTEYEAIQENSYEERDDSLSFEKRASKDYEEEKMCVSSPSRKNQNSNKTSNSGEEIPEPQARKLMLREKSKSTTFHEGSYTNELVLCPSSLVLAKTSSDVPLTQSAKIGREERNYNKKYIDILKKARDKEKVFRTQINDRPGMKNSKNKKIEQKNKENPQKLDDRFFEKNMLKLSVTQDHQNIEEGGQCCCQVVRSASNWSMGLRADKESIENSIQVAYVELIKNAKHFIYIENQFFISSTAGDPVTNEIAHALCFRIEKAHAMGQDFKVVIFLPLLPGFEGEVDDPTATVLRIQLHWEYFTISRGGKSLIEELEKRGVDPKQYINFYSLRQHGKMNGVPVTEIIYIHSKLMIIDDDKVIMGSANINDRSMQGSRDSEIAMVVEDFDKIPMTMNGKEVMVGKFAHTLRVNLYKEHLNFQDEEVEDPLDPALNERMDAIAKINTRVFREVFACYPDDEVTKLQEVKEFKETRNLDRYDELAGQIQGNIVEFPLHFLVDDDLTFKMTNKEYLVPNINFT